MQDLWKRWLNLRISFFHYLTLIFFYYFFKCHVYFYIVAPRVVEDEYDEDGVRAPIPQKQETLIQPGKFFHTFSYIFQLSIFFSKLYFCESGKSFLKLILPLFPGFEGYAMNRSASNRGSRTSRVRSVFDGFRNFSNEASKFPYKNLIIFFHD